MILRRHLLFAALPAVASPWALGQDRPDFRRAAFDAKSLSQTLKALGLATATPSKDVVLQAPELFEDGTVVPLTIACTLPGVQRLLVGVDHNPTWLAATFDVTEAVEPRVSVRLKMQETSPVTVLAVMADGRVLSATKDVKITLGGCGGAAEPAPAQAATQPTLIRVQAAGAGATVRALMKHDMESGQRKDDAGKPVPAWHIQEVTARLNGQTVLAAQWGPAVSKNPFLQFGLRSAKPGDKVSLAWADNRGASRSDEVVFAAA